MAEKVTVMVLKVDLQCPCCYKKIRKILCKFPQIRGQIYDEKQNTVTISVVCCSPEKIRDKLCCKGGKVIQSIDIIKPPSKPKEPEKKPPPPKNPEKPPVVVVEKPNIPKKPIEVPKPVDKLPLAPPPEPVKKPEPVPVPVPVHPDPQPIYPPARTCCGPCSEGYGGGPCYDGYPAPPPCYDGYYGYGHGCGCGCGRGCNLRGSVSYIEEENPSSCKIM